VSKWGTLEDLCRPTLVTQIGVLLQVQIELGEQDRIQVGSEKDEKASKSYGERSSALPTKAGTQNERSVYGKARRVSIRAYL